MKCMNYWLSITNSVLYESAFTANPVRLLLVGGTALGLLNVKSQQFEIIQSSTFDSVALAFDVARGWYYWADSRGNIYKSDGQQSWTAYTGWFTL